MGSVPIKASDVDRRLTTIWRFGLPPGLRDGCQFNYTTFLALLDAWANECTEKQSAALEEPHHAG